MSLVLDYLRACGARTADVADLLDSYLRQPPVARQRADAAVADTLKTLPEPVRKAMLKWDKGVADAREAKAAADTGKKKPRVETDRQRVFRIVWSFIHANWNEELEARLYAAMLKVKDKVPRSQRKDACRAGRRMFGILTKTYAKEKRKQAALAQAQAKAREDGFPDEVVSALLQAATEAYTTLLLSGRLDWEPTEEQILKATGQSAQGRESRDPARDRRDSARSRVQQDLCPRGLAGDERGGGPARRAQARLPLRETALLQLAGTSSLPIAFEHGTDSPEWKANVEVRIPRLHDPARRPRSRRDSGQGVQHLEGQAPARAAGLRRSRRPDVRRYALDTNPNIPILKPYGNSLDDRLPWLGTA